MDQTTFAADSNRLKTELIHNCKFLKFCNICLLITAFTAFIAAAYEYNLDETFIFLITGIISLSITAVLQNYKNRNQQLQNFLVEEPSIAISFLPSLLRIHPALSREAPSNNFLEINYTNISSIKILNYMWLQKLHSSSYIIILKQKSANEKKIHINRIDFIKNQKELNALLSQKTGIPIKMENVFENSNS